MLKKYNLLSLAFVGITLALIISSCNNAGSDPTEEVKNRKSDFNPDYFRSGNNFYYSLKVLYNHGDYSLADTTVFKIPGRYRNPKTNGDLNIFYRDAGGIIFDTLTTSFPFHFLKEFKNVKDTASHIMGFDSVVFMLPLSNRNSTYSISFSDKTFVLDSLMVPDDTLDVMDQNFNAALDSSVFN
ncbi:MAG: hypothetical protein ACHQNT_00075 [Bacteroidia bacterium]